MPNDLLSPVGPLLGPNVLRVMQNDATGKPFQLEIYPDANNAMLRSNGVPMHFYLVPQRVFLARKYTAPADFDFGMTILKGLLTTEDTIGVTDQDTSGGAVEIGGGFCTFATTFAIPESVIRGAAQQLRQLQGLAAGDPTPELGIVNIVENNVTIEVPEFEPYHGRENEPVHQRSGRGAREALKRPVSALSW